MMWAAFRWVLLMFLIAPAMEAPLVAHLNQPVKPIKTWVGNASWYGPGFTGRKTANGERFDSEALTAAHPNLPFGSLVRVVNPRNGSFEGLPDNPRGGTRHTMCPAPFAAAATCPGARRVQAVTPIERES